MLCCGGGTAKVVAPAPVEGTYTPTPKQVEALAKAAA